MSTIDRTHSPFVAGVEYFSGLDPGGGYLLMFAMGRPVDISGFTTTTSPRTRCQLRMKSRTSQYERNFFQKPFGERWYRVDSTAFLVAIRDDVQTLDIIARK